VLPALAGVVHDGQAADYQHHHREDDQHGGFHCGLATAGPKPSPVAEFSPFKNEPAVNAVNTAEAPNRRRSLA